MNTKDPARARHERLERWHGHPGVLAAVVVASLATVALGVPAGLGFGGFMEQFRTMAIDSIFDDRGDADPSYVVVWGTLGVFGCLFTASLAGAAARRYRGRPTGSAFPAVLALAGSTVGAGVSARGWLPPLAVGTAVDPVFHQDEAWGFWGWLFYYADWWVPALLLVVTPLVLGHAVTGRRPYTGMVRTARSRPRRPAAGPMRSFESPEYVVIKLVRGFLTGAVIGVTLSAFVTGIIIENVPLILTGVGLPFAYGLLLFVAGMPRRAREAAVVPRVALAKIESLRAGGTETGDVPVRFDLTIAPHGEPSFRAEARLDVNLVDLPGYRPGDVLVVAYPPDRPWKVRIVKPDAEWARRAAGATLASAPESTVARKPSAGAGPGFLVLVGLLVGAAVVVLQFRAELFAPAMEASEPTSVTSSSGSATVIVGPGQSLADAGELRRAVDGLAQHADVAKVLTAVVEEHRLSVVFAPTGVTVPSFDLRALPVDRVPALVAKARSTLEVGAPQTWQVTVVPFVGQVTLRIVVTGPDGSASLGG
ncbi:hypothetical protein [Amycolatopsis sp. cmx-8-4]|uniref:hypothetical protein n=1 Tax=Amycolatopsis sp. cmx-8-4 TaxID=2790947 RepID=UPI00397DB221